MDEEYSLGSRLDEAERRALLEQRVNLLEDRLEATLLTVDDLQAELRQQSRAFAKVASTLAAAFAPASTAAATTSPQPKPPPPAPSKPS